MALSVKAYLEKGRATTPEIRRFTIDQGASTNFAYFSSKLMQVFPALNGQRFTTYWKDAEDDDVAFSSDEELVEALGSMNDDVFKVYVKVGDGGEEANKGVHHPGVTCDGCEGSVYGTRFKCSVCPDYDLCGTCEQTGLHPEHHMTRITTPRSPNPFMAFGQMFGGHPGMHQAWGGPPPHCRRWFEQSKKNAEKKQGASTGASTSAEKEPTEGTSRSQCHWEMPPQWQKCWEQFKKNAEQKQGAEKGEAEGANGGPGQMPPQWQQWADRMFTDAQGIFGGMRPQGEEGREARQEGGEDKGAGASADAGPSQTGDKNQEKNERENYLKNIGETIAAMLDPFGIDVDYDIEHHGDRARQPTSPPSSGSCAGKQGKKCGGAKGKREEKSKADDMDTSTSQMNTEEKMDQTPSGTTDTSKTSHSNARAQSESPDGEWTILQTDVPSSQTPGKTSTDHPEDQGKPQQFSFVTPDRQSQGPAVPSASPNQQGSSLYPQIPEPMQDPKMTHALEQMKSMGFNDDGGWLTRLLTAKGGDIGRVLDAVKPQKSS